MYGLDTNFENVLAREKEKQDMCKHTYLKCGQCHRCFDNLNNIYKQEIDRLNRLLITHGIDPKNVII